jgi:hypothetical protein
MADEQETLNGSYAYENGKFIPKGDMALIERTVGSMKMLAGSTETGAGEFYYDAETKAYWHYIQYEDYRTTLQSIERSEIESKYPTVDCDHLIDIQRE